MKKLLFSVFTLATAFALNAQMLESDNYSAYNLGDVTSTTTAVGQGGMSVGAGTVADYQIVNGDAAHGKYLQVITGADGTTVSSRYVFKEDNLIVGWTNRTPGNDIIKGSANIFTGTSTNKHNSGFAIFGATAGIVGLRYNSQTKTIVGLANLTQPGQPSGFYNITGLTTNTYPANVWINVGYSYNKTTGEITYTIDGVQQTLTITGIANTPGLDPTEFDVYSSPTRLNATDPANVGTTTFGIDNYTVEASNNTTLGTSEIYSGTKSLIAIGPNPTEDYLNILTSQKIIKVEVYDMSGKRINVKLEGNKINVQQLASGSYILSLETNETKVSEIFIKK